jgi:hypothetical protein
VQAAEYQLVYDILTEGYLRLSWAPIAWLAVGILISSIYVSELRRKVFKFERRKDIVALAIMLGFLALGVFGVVSTIRTQYGCISAAKKGDFDVVEGPITKLSTNPRQESFVVNNIRFNHREYDFLRCGYAQSKGVVMKENMPVRIAHKNGCIFKMEVVR